MIANIGGFYADKGGMVNLAGAKAMIDIHLSVLKMFGIVEEDANGKLSLKHPG